MVSSVDFFIASKDNSMSWLETVDSYEEGVTGEDAEEFLKAIDCYVMGSRTYEHALVLGWPYGDTPTIVLTHRGLRSDRKSVEFHSGDLNKLLNEKLKPRFKNIWVVGGAAVAKDFIRMKLADDIRITTIPILLGDGTLFVDRVGEEHPLH